MVLSHQVDGNLWQQLRKGTRRPRHARGGALAAGPAGRQARTGRGLLGGGRRTSGLQGAPGPAQAQVEEAPPEPRGAAWVCPRRPRPSCPLAPEPRGGQGGASSPVPCREAERRSAAGPRPSRLAHAHATSGGTEGARCSARGSPHRHPVTPSPRVTPRHRGLAVRPRPQPLVLGPALRPPAPRLSCPLARGRLIHPVLWLFLNIASQGPI